MDTKQQLWFPLDGSKDVDWSDTDQEWQSWELTDYEHEGEVHKIVVGNDGRIHGVVVDGKLLDEADLRDRAGDLQESVSDLELQESVDESALSAATDEAVRFYRILAAIEHAEIEGVPSASGPMMNYFYPVSSEDDDRGPEWAAKVTGPLCVVHLNEQLGLALTGGGMDLSWEIAEAFVALGYYPPTWVDLPAMASRGTSEEDLVIVDAVAAHKQRAAESLLITAGRLWERYHPSADLTQPE